MDAATADRLRLVRVLRRSDEARAGSVSPLGLLVRTPSDMEPRTDVNHDLARYHRQTLLPGFGDDGQRKLLSSTALVLGCGALGTVVVDLLARAGVGHLVIVDRDFVELTNLQRQVLFDEQDVADALPKAEAAK